MGLEKYESKQQQIFKPAARIFPFISRFDMLKSNVKMTWIYGIFVCLHVTIRLN